MDAEPEISHVTRTLEKRLARLSKLPQFQPPPPPSAEDLLFREKALELLASLDPKYSKPVLESLTHPPQEWSGLALAILTRVLDHVRENRPLAFPSELAEAYLENPYADHESWCRGCKFRLPRGCFEVCPLCGSQLGVLSR